MVVYSSLTYFLKILLIRVYGVYVFEMAVLFLLAHPVDYYMIIRYSLRYVSGKVQGVGNVFFVTTNLLGF